MLFVERKARHAAKPQTAFLLQGKKRPCAGIAVAQGKVQGGLSSTGEDYVILYYSKKFVKGFSSLTSRQVLDFLLLFMK